jgi:polar amino acid transport system substrate-binding protein
MKLNYFLSILIFLFISLPGSCEAAAKKEIEVVIYYDYPPFYIEKNKHGLGKELAEHLTSKAKGKYIFNSSYIPKGRVDKMLTDPNWQGVVAWINPKFVNDQSMSKYVWSNPIMHEIDYVASLKELPIEFKDQTSLYGHKLGAVLNQRYADVEDAISAGKIKRVDTIGQESVVNMLLKKRVEVAFFSKSTIKWFKKEFPDFDDKIYLAKKTRNEFDRYVLITPKLDKDATHFILKTVNNLKNDHEWNKRLKEY